MIEVIEVTKSQRLLYNDQLRRFESKFTYPFGDDFFSIDHGKDYFKFFDLIGEPHTFIALKNRQIIGVAVIVLKNLEKPCWYICDLKIDTKFRGKGIVEDIFREAIEYRSVSKEIYGISMDSLEGKNRLIDFSKKIPFLNLEYKESILFYLVKVSDLEKISAFLQEYFEDYGFLSLSGIKDIIMQSTGLKFPLIHLAPKSISNRKLSDVGESNIMFCIKKSHKFNSKLSEIGIKHITTASIISNMDDVDWGFILSSEI